MHAKTTTCAEVKENTPSREIFMYWSKSTSFKWALTLLNNDEPPLVRAPNETAQQRMLYVRSQPRQTPRGGANSPHVMDCTMLLPKLCGGGSCWRNGWNFGAGARSSSVTSSRAFEARTRCCSCHVWVVGDEKPSSRLDRRPKMGTKNTRTTLKSSACGRGVDPAPPPST